VLQPEASHDRVQSEGTHNDVAKSMDVMYLTIMSRCPPRERELFRYLNDIETIPLKTPNTHTQSNTGRCSAHVLKRERIRSTTTRQQNGKHHFLGTPPLHRGGAEEVSTRRGDTRTCSFSNTGIFPYPPLGAQGAPARTHPYGLPVARGVTLRKTQ
jgi:hypothetical protein